LRVLFASHNPFTELPSVLGQLPELEMVGFRACRIAEVPPHSLPARLRWLILTDNCLTSVPDALGERPRLQKLMLSCNQLTALPASLVRCNRLELLRMASNRFTAVPEVLLQLPQLAWPALAGNPLTQASEQQLHAAAAAKACPLRIWRWVRCWAKAPAAISTAPATRAAERSWRSRSSRQPTPATARPSPSWRRAWR
jgi:hypothetical protein